MGRQKSSIKKSGENQLPPAPDTLSAPGNLKQLSGPQLPPPGEHDRNHALTAVKGLLKHDLVYLPQVALRRLPGMRWTDTDTGCPPNTGTHLNLQLPGGRHRAGGKGQEGCRRAPNRPLSQKGEGMEILLSRLQNLGNPKWEHWKTGALVRLLDPTQQRWGGTCFVHGHPASQGQNEDSA